MKEDSNNLNNTTLPLDYLDSKLACGIRDGVSISVFGMSMGEILNIASWILDYTERLPVFIETDYIKAKAVFDELNSNLKLVNQDDAITDTLIVDETDSNQVIDINSCEKSVSKRPRKFYFLPARADTLRNVQIHEKTNGINRSRVFRSLIKGECSGIVTTIDAVLQIFPDANKYKESCFNIKKNEDFVRDELVERLVGIGYERTDLCESNGTFALRGDILDIFPIDCQFPYRIEFWGDTIERILKIDPQTNLATKEKDGIFIVPACETLYSSQQAANVCEILNKEYRKNRTAIVKDKDGNFVEEYLHREQLYTSIISKLECGAIDSSQEIILPYLTHGTFFDFLPQKASILFDETKALLDIAQSVIKEHESRYRSLLFSGETLHECNNQIISLEQLTQRISTLGLVSFSRILTSNLFFEPNKIFNYTVSPITKYSFNFEQLSDDIKIWINRGYSILIYGENKIKSENIIAGLQKFSVTANFCCSIAGFLGNHEKFGHVFITNLHLARGYTYHDARIVVIGSGDIFPKKVNAIRKIGSKIFVQPKPGDYVVHYVHGIGKCVGVKQITTSDGTKDYIEIEYRDGDKLFVPVDQMDLLSRYSGETPKLSKMGGVDFAKAKARVKEQLSKLAVDLVKLYSERLNSRGYKYSVDSMMMNDFVSRFPYESTLDQTVAFDEIKKDLESGKIMDRLLVGDVGFGKTEVALRAAFACICEGKQVAMLAPTTILSQQHFITAKKRFDEFGIRSAVLNRFIGTAKQKDTLKKLQSSEVDFLCGTHRILSRDVIFKDLGLLILDEEQRFGVADKEKIKELKSSVNVLTMSATPIPRTLHMSMVGIRDISTLADPPSERIPVQTVVCEYSHSLVIDAITREIARGGQSFVVYNRVETIFHFASILQDLLPNARIIVCHGQMSETELENGIRKFYDGDGDVLLSTTIVENGIDLPNANTMIVIDSDRLGLSQSYQLRGRVGRSSRLAYAYFTYPRGKVLSTESTKRLRALTDHTSFGSGFKIAQRDLEIRGTGNVLGREQSGHMEQIGYDLYVKLLSQAVKEASGQKVVPIETVECEVVMDVDAYLPSNYIQDDESRMNIYSRISSVKNMQEHDRLLGEIANVYGNNIPKEVKNLVRIGLYKGLGMQLGIVMLRVKRDLGAIILPKMFAWVAHMLSKKDLNITLKAAQKPMIIFNPTKESMYERVYNFLIDGIAERKRLKIMNSNV